MAGPWVSPHSVIHGLQGKACLVGQEATPKPQPRPQQSLTRCEQRELPVCPGLGPACQGPQTTCPHFAERESETRVQRSQRTNLSTGDTPASWCGPNSRKETTAMRNQGWGAAWALHADAPTSNPRPTPLAV